MYDSFIGLEIHIHLETQSKIFCGCQASFGAEPNTNICPVCMGYPGVLPALNVEAMKQAYIVARALNCKLSKNTVMERKNYFYPDLPKNYQISQFDNPVGLDGYIEVPIGGDTRRIRIHDVHLEEDAGKMIHAGDMSLLDYNRTGYPLLEIVTEPDLVTGEEAEVFLKSFRRLVRYLGVCDGNLEEGSMRCDANVSINHKGKGLGSKVEIKNLNSFKFVKNALNFEIERQSVLLGESKKVQQETRLWNENRDLTESMRTKEKANDYRYFPEPDLPPFRPDEAFLAEVEKSLIELPEERRTRIIAEYNLTNVQAGFIYDEKSVADFFEKTVTLGAKPEMVAAWLSSDIQKILNREGLELTESPLTEYRLASMLKALHEERIHGKIAKKVLEAVFKEDKDPENIIEEQGLSQITDSSALKSIIAGTLSEHNQAVEQIKAGEHKAIGFIVGQVMKKTGGKAKPQLVQQIIREELDIS